MTYEPERVREARDRKLGDQRLPENAFQPRLYFCRGCGAEQRAALVPRGWYMLMRASGSLNVKPTRLGVYCSARCVESQFDRLVGIEDDLGDRFDTAPSAFRQR
jgi:hypothetical protein